jgi:hypothetical protein
MKTSRHLRTQWYTAEHMPLSEVDLACLHVSTNPSCPQSGPNILILSHWGRLCLAESGALDGGNLQW